VQAVLGAVLIVLGLVFVVMPWFVGAPGSRGHDLWTAENRIKAGLVGVGGIVAGILLLTGGVA
jgi:hypothetical protein